MMGFHELRSPTTPRSRHAPDLCVDYSPRFPWAERVWKSLRREHKTQHFFIFFTFDQKCRNWMCWQILDSRRLTGLDIVHEYQVLQMHRNASFSGKPLACEAFVADELFPAWGLNFSACWTWIKALRTDRYLQRGTASKFKVTRMCDCWIAFSSGLGRDLCICSSSILFFSCGETKFFCTLDVHGFLFFVQGDMISLLVHNILVVVFVVVISGSGCSSRGWILFCLLGLVPFVAIGSTYDPVFTRLRSSPIFADVTFEGYQSRRAFVAIWRPSTLALRESFGWKAWREDL